MPARSNASQDGLQQQPLLRVHRERLARRDAEERRRRTRRRRAGSRPRGRRWCPAVGSGSYSASRSQPRSAGNAADRVAAVGDAAATGPPGESTPPGKRQLMPTIAIGSSSRSTGDRGGPATGRSRRRAARRAGDAASAARGRVVEDQRGGQPQAGGGGEPVAQLDRGQRVEAEVPERAVGLDARRRRRGRARRRPASRTRSSSARVPLGARTRRGEPVRQRPESAAAACGQRRRATRRTSGRSASSGLGRRR